MRRSLFIGTALVCLLAAGSAHALGSFGFRAGAGLGAWTSLDPADGVEEAGPNVPWAIGAAWKLDLSLIGFEADLLYRQGSAYIPSRGVEVSQQQLALPMMLRVGIPFVPFLEVGAGIEPRLLISSDGSPSATDTLETWVWYAPIALGVSFDLGGFELSAEARLELQVSNHYLGPQADEARQHNVMLYVGGFF